MSNTPTPHISCNPGDFAKTVLMPGDPLRAEFIANTFLTEAKLVNNVRGIQGYTGLYKDKPVSVMASGMGIPSIGIYSYELFHFYGVENIIRVGTAGGLSDSVNVRDVVIGLSSYTNSNFGRQFGFDGNVAPCCSFKLLEQAVAAARRMGIEPSVGPLYSSDIFYDESGMSGKLKKLGVLAVEMESAALYLNAARAGKNALAICTISDHLSKNESLDAQARQSSFTQMMEIALDIA